MDILYKEHTMIFLQLIDCQTFKHLSMYMCNFNFKTTSFSVCPKLCTSVIMYSSGVPTSLVTVIFLVSREPSLSITGGSNDINYSEQYMEDHT